MCVCLQLATIGLSCLLFSLANSFFPDVLRPPAGRHLIGFDEWKWRNIVVSLGHSLISGLGALFLTRDYVSGSVALSVIGESSLSQVLLCFSIGYFVYDSLLSWSTLRLYPGRGEIIVHHVITMLTLGLSLVEGLPLLSSLLPACVFGLVIELSNVFLHLRSLLDLAADTPLHRTTLYRLNSAWVIASVFVFRFLPLLWISADIRHTILAGKGFLVIALVHLPILAIVLISGIICFRILQEDFLQTTTTSTETTEGVTREVADAETDSEKKAR